MIASSSDLIFLSILKIQPVHVIVLVMVDGSGSKMC